MIKNKLTTAVAASILLFGGAATPDIIREGQIAALPDYDKLETSKTELLEARRSEKEVAYSYRTAEKVSESEPLADKAAQDAGTRLAGERIEERTGTARVFDTETPGVTIHVIIAARQQYLKEGDEWSVIGYGTTTPEAYDLQTELTPLEELFGVRTVEAQTFNPSFDGMVYASNVGTWAGARDASAGTSASDSQTSDNIAAEFVIGTYWVQRGFFLYDTSSIADGDTITAAVLSLHGDPGDSVGNTDSVSMSIVASTPASNTTLVTDDFDQVGGTAFASIALSSWTTGGYNDFTLDANGRANVSKTGISKFAARLSNDISNTTPTGTDKAFVRHSETAGTSQDPKLVITATAPAANSDPLNWWMQVW